MQYLSNLIANLRLCLRHQKALRGIFINHNPIILPYSGNDDTVGDLTPSFWIVPKDLPLSLYLHIFLISSYAH